VKLRDIRRIGRGGLRLEVCGKKILGGGRGYKN